MQSVQKTGAEPFRLKPLGNPPSPARDDDTDVEPEPWYKNRWVWLGCAVAVVALIGAAVLLRDKPAGADAAATAGSPPKGDVAKVRVITPGLSSVTSQISITGTLAAKYEMPVGVEADGGRIAQILVEAGQTVGAGQVLARVDTTIMQAQVQQMAASVEEARASARLAQADLARAMPVAQSGALSRAELDRRKAAVDTTAARVKVMEAQYAEMRARLNRMDIRAPAAGLVLERQVELGQTVNAGNGPLFKLAKGGAVELRGQVAEQDMPQLNVGQPVRVSISGVDRQWTGRVWLLGATIDPQSRMGMVRIDLPADSQLRPGAFARAAIDAATVQRPVLPQSAVLADAKGSFVMVNGKDNKIERRDIRIGNSSAAGVTVTEGLTGGESVVVSAGPFLRIGEQIDPVKSDPKTLR